MVVLRVQGAIHMLCGCTPNHSFLIRLLHRDGGGDFLPLLQVGDQHVVHGLRFRNEAKEQDVARLANSIQKPNLGGRLLIGFVPIHHVHGSPSRDSLCVALLVKLLEDDVHGLLLDIPRFGRRIQVAGCHCDRLDQHPVLDYAPGELFLFNQRRQFRFVREEDGQVSGQDAVFDQA